MGVLLLVFAFLPQIILPSLVSSALEARLKEKLGGDFCVEVASQSTWDLIKGKLNNIIITGHNLVFNNLPITQLEARCVNLKTDLKQLIKGKGLSYESYDSLGFLLTLDEADLNAYYWHQVDPNKNFNIELAQDGAALNGEINFWGVNWKLKFIGQIDVIDQTKIVFSPSELLVLDTRIPQVLLELINKHYRLSIDLDKMPVPVKIDQIKLGENKIIFIGSGVFL